MIVQQIGCTSVRDARYTSTGKIPVSIIFQMVRYQNLAHFGISYAAVMKFTCSASQIAVHPGVKCDNSDGSNRLNSINVPKINK